MDFLESILLDPSSVTFTVLFVGLFVYVTRRNEKREEELYQALRECHQSKNTSIPAHIKRKRK